MKHTPAAVLLIVALSAASCASQTSPGASASLPIANRPADGAASQSAPDPLQGWQPSPKQQATLATLPKDVQAQRAELLRLLQIPLPSYEERRRMQDLMGDGFPEEHPLRENEQFMMDYYRSQPQPSRGELDELVASLKQRMIYVPGGRFMMGDFGPQVFDKLTITGDRNNAPHEVALDSFSIMKGRVTFGELDLYNRATGQPLLPQADFVDAVHHRPGYMARPITWPQADGYCRWLRDLTGQPFTLPTEAQWEYAAREGGKLLAYPVQDYPGVKWQNEYIPDFQSLDDAIGVVRERAGRATFFIEPRPTWLYGENRIGMQAVAGSSDGEWTSDWYSESPPKAAVLHNPRGPETGTQKVLRPSAYGRDSTILSRHPRSLDSGNYFRCVIDAAERWR